MAWFKRKGARPESTAPSTAPAKAPPAEAPAPPSGSNSEARVFDYDDQYRTLHGGVHRKGASRVGTPALTRHFAFWLPKIDAGKNYQTRRDAWVANIDWFLASIIRNVYVSARPSEAPTSLNARQTGKDSYKFVLLRHSVDYKRGHDGKEEWKPIVNARGAPDKTWDARYETVSFHFYYDGVPIKMRAELHTEYFALSFFAELDCACEADQQRLSGRAVPDHLSREFATIAEVCGRRWLEAQNGATKRVPRDPAKEHMEADVKLLKQSATHLYKTFWDDFDKAILKAALTPDIIGPKEADATKEDLKAHLGGVFADFRGLVLSTKREEAPKPPPSPDSAEAKTCLFDAPFGLPERSSLADYISLGKMQEVNQIHLLDALLPLIDAGRRAHAHEENLPTVEYAAASLHDRRAVYISALGPQPLFHRHEEPVCYIVATKHRHRWQISRLLDRMHTLGTLRVATLWDFETLNRKSADLREVTRSLDRIDSAGEIDKVAWHDAAARFRAAQRDEGYGGPQYRAERSRFYVDQFHRECESMRFDRIEGFQPYVAFVMRRVGRTWNHILNLADRCRVIGRRLNTLGSEIRAKEAIAQSKALAEQTKNMVEQTRELAALLTFAEFSAAIPVAYYGGHLLHDVAVGEFGRVMVEDWIGSARSPLLLGEGDFMLIALALYILVVAVLNPLRRKRLA